MFSGALGVVIFIMCLIAPVVIITLIIIATTRKNKDSNPKKFEETIRAIYIYIVLIVLFVIIVLGVIYLFEAIIDCVLPEKYVNHVQSDLEFNTVQSNIIEVTSNTQRELDEQNQRNQNIVNLITAISTLIISIPIFIYYSRLANNKI